MSLAFFGPKGSVEVRWIVYALLRDNVQHYLEGGQVTDDFAEIHRIADALVETAIFVSAVRLRAQTEQARSALLVRPATDLALSERTRAVLSGRWPPARTGTSSVGAALALPLLHEGIRTMADVFGHLVLRLLEITDGAGPGDKVEVRDQ